MMRKISVIAVCSIALALGLACSDPPEGGSGGNGTSAVPGSPAVDQVKQAYAQGICDGIWSCYGEALPATFLGEELQHDGLSSRQECEEFITDSWDSEELQDAVDQERVHIDVNRLDSCSSALESNLCSNDHMFFLEETLWIPECRQAVQGQVDAGGHCIEDAECADGGMCRRGHEDLDDDVCYGLCVPQEETLEECGDTTCEPNEECAELDGEPTCISQSMIPCEDDMHCEDVQGTCGSDGFCDYDPMELIEIVDEGESCSGSDAMVVGCELGTACVLTEADDGLSCQPLVGEGETCIDGRNCEMGLYCDRDEGEAGECAPLLEPGEPCEASNQCQGRCNSEEQQSDDEESSRVCADISTESCELPE